MKTTNTNTNTKKRTTHTIVVLPDGETWNTINGCSVVVIDEAQFEDLCANRVNASDLIPIVEIALRDMTPPQA